MSLRAGTERRQGWRRLLQSWAGAEARLPLERGTRGALDEYGWRLALLGAVVAANVVVACLVALAFLPGYVVLLAALVAALAVRAFPQLSDAAARLSGAARDALAPAGTAATEGASGEAGDVPTLSPREIASFLAESELFRKVDPEALRKLAEVAGIRSVAKGQTIFSQGDRGEQMFVLVEGEVRLVMRSPRGRVVELAHLLAPAAFGEVVLTDPGPRTATAEAVERSVLLVLDGSDVFPLLRSDANAMEALLRSQGAMVRRADRLAADLVFLTPQSRVAGALLDLAASGIGRGERPRTRRLGDAELASIVAARRSQVSRILRRFERLGYIRRVGLTIELLDPDELGRRAGR